MRLAYIPFLCRPNALLLASHFVLAKRNAVTVGISCHIFILQIYWTLNPANHDSKILELIYLNHSRPRDSVIKLPITRNQIRRMEVSLVLYRTMQYLNQLFSTGFSSIILPWLLLFLIVLQATSSFVLIRLHSSMHILILLTFPTLSFASVAFVFIAFPVAASVNSLSSSYLASLKTERNENKYQWGVSTACYIRSCRTLRIQCGSGFYIRKFTVLKLISVMILWTVRYMLLYRLK